MITTETTDTRGLLVSAIRGKRLVSFTLDGRRRVAEPHDYGVIGGEERLFFFQVGGESRSGQPHGWRWAVMRRVANLAVLDQTFAGSRLAPSGRHVKWDQIIASVSVRDARP